MNRWLIVAPLSVGLGWVLSAAHVPAAWILGAIIVSGSVALVSGRELRLPKRLFSFARGTIGVLAAVPLIGIPARDLASFLIPGLVAAAFTIGLAFVGGLVLANHGVSRETGVLSLLAGGASVMPAIAEEVGADVRYVALSQYLRLLTVSITLPLVASVMAPSGAGAHAAGAAQAAAPVASPWMWLLVPALVLGGIPLGKLLHLPNASVFGPMLVTVLVGTVADFPITPPMPLTVASLIAIGWLAGGGLNTDALKRFSRMLPATMAYIVGLMAACAGVGWVMSKWLSISLYEGYLATTPGALETVLALSAEGNAGPAVITLQLIRLICVLVFAAYLPRILKAL